MKVTQPIIKKKNLFIDEMLAKRVGPKSFRDFEMT